MKRYYILINKDFKTQEIRKFTIEELKAFKKSNTRVKVTELGKTIFKETVFKKVFELYNESLLTRSTSFFITLLQEVKDQYKLDQVLIDFIRSTGINNYFGQINGKLYEKIGIKKDFYLTLLNQRDINEEDKSTMVKELLIIPEKKSEIKKILVGKAMGAYGYLLGGIGIGYFILFQTLPSIGKSIPGGIDTTLASTLFFGSASFVIILSILIGLSLTILRTQVLLFLLKFNTTGDIIRGMNTLEYLLLTLIGNYLSQDELKRVVNKTFPFIKVSQNIALIDITRLILNKSEYKQFFDVKVLITLLNTSGKGSAQIKETVKRISGGLPIILSSKIASLGKILTTIGLIFAVASLIGPFSGFFSLFSGMLDGIKGGL